MKRIHGKAWSSAWIPHSSVKKHKQNKWFVEITSVLEQETGEEVQQLLKVTSH